MFDTTLFFVSVLSHPVPVGHLAHRLVQFPVRDKQPWSASYNVTPQRHILMCQPESDRHPASKASCSASAHCVDFHPTLRMPGKQLDRTLPVWLPAKDRL